MFVASSLRKILVVWLSGILMLQQSLRLAAFRATAASCTRQLQSACRPQSIARSTSSTTTTTSTIRATLATNSRIRSAVPTAAFVNHSKQQQTRLFSGESSNNEEEGDSFFANESVTFESLGIESQVLMDRLKELGLTRPTKVQAQTFDKLKASDTATSVIIGSETGSGKTLAYLLPLLDSILQEKQQSGPLSYDYARAIILVPNKELVQQVLRMALPLCGGKDSIVWGANNLVLPKELEANKQGKSMNPSQRIRLAVMPGGLMEPMDFKPFRDTLALGGEDPPVDLILSTPAAVGPLALKPKHIDMFADIQTLIVDEADMLLDGGYIRPLQNVLMGFKRADKLDASLGVQRTQHVFCAATLPNMGLKSVDAYLQRKFPRAERISMSGMHNARHYGLQEATQWIGPVETKKERMDSLIQLLETPVEEGGLQNEKVMVFLNSVDDVDGAQGAFERAGLPSVPYHAKISLGDRSKNLDRYRRYSSEGDNDEDSVPILVCTDLASRGLDVPGVTAVVQLQFSGNVVSHLHRMGRCGRAGQKTGRGIVFFNEAEAELVDVVREAETQQEQMVLEGDVDEELLPNVDEDGNPLPEAGKVQKAFSRKRGFTKKRKKLRRDAA